MIEKKEPQSENTVETQKAVNMDSLLTQWDRARSEYVLLQFKDVPIEGSDAFRGLLVIAVEQAFDAGFKTCLRILGGTVHASSIPDASESANASSKQKET